LDLPEWIANIDVVLELGNGRGRKIKPVLQHNIAGRFS